MAIDFAPLLPWKLIIFLAAMGSGLVALALRRNRRYALRFLPFCAILGALSGPGWHHVTSEPLENIVVVLRDQSMSQYLDVRDAQSADALAHVREVAEGLGLSIREYTIPDGSDDQGTQAMAVLRRALNEVPPAQLAGILFITDGRIHDMKGPEDMPDLQVPLHVLLTGRASDWDRRLEIATLPDFGIVGEELPLSFTIFDEGAAFGDRMAVVRIAFDGGVPFETQVPVGQQVNLPIKLPHGGVNVMNISTPEQPGELTERNNRAVLQVNGVRDRLRVLLVSGAPHNGARTWRNLLTADAAVDLVHFTILRSPDSQDYTPLTELSLIAFPTRELFLQKIDAFDLIIFDRYPLRGILTPEYLDSVRGYGERGGAILVAAGPDFAGPNSIYRSALSRILPARPTARVIEDAFLPKLNAAGHRHPVTRGLPGAGEMGGEPVWGHWLRQVELVPDRGEVLMTGAQGLPLLILDEIESGRIALLASDQAWLWDRGFEGGGPQFELLRRLAHWLMKEPDLEAERLHVALMPDGLNVTRRTMQDTVGPLKVEGPEGSLSSHEMSLQENGDFAASLGTLQEGMYRFSQDGLEAVFVIGPASPREFAQPLSDAATLRPLVEASGGKMLHIEQSASISMRMVRDGARTYGQNWIGFLDRDATRSMTRTRIPFMPDWAWLISVVCLIVAVWYVEGRRR